MYHSEQFSAVVLYITIFFFFYRTFTSIFELKGVVCFWQPQSICPIMTLVQLSFWRTRFTCVWRWEPIDFNRHRFKGLSHKGLLGHMDAMGASLLKPPPPHPMRVNTELTPFILHFLVTAGKPWLFQRKISYDETTPVMHHSQLSQSLLDVC